MSYGCKLCSLNFPSRTQLFKHINISHSAGDGPTVKIALLVGCNPPPPSKTANNENFDGYTGGRSLTWNDSQDHDYFEQCLWEGLAQLNQRSLLLTNDNLISPTVCTTTRPTGWSRCTSIDSRVSPYLSQSIHMPVVSELVCLNSSMIPKEEENKWVQDLNEILPKNVKVHRRCNVHVSTHAEKHCELRRYEVLVPLAVLSPHLIDKNLNSAEFQTFLNDESFEVSENEPTTQNGWDENWKQFLRKLKSVEKKFQGRFNWHNFAPGVLPHDVVARTPKIIRFRHLNVLTPFVNTTSQTSANGAMVSNVEHISTHHMKDSFLVFSIHGNMLLRGMCESMVGLMIAVMRGWLPEDAIENALRPDVIATALPTIPSNTCLFVEGRYDNFENKHRVSLFPRLKTSSDISVQPNNKTKKRKPDWKCEQCGENNFAKRTSCFKCQTLSGGGTSEDMKTIKKTWSGFENENDIDAILKSNSKFRHQILKSLVFNELHEKQFDSWASDMEANLTALRSAFEQACNHAAPVAACAVSIVPKTSPEEEGNTSHANIVTQVHQHVLNQLTPSSDLKYEAYHRTLHLLRQADASGLWPASSPTRSRVILQPDQVSSIGGTFALGSQPPPLEHPKGNTLFKELLVSAFQLEALLMPNRKPSSTIAVNRHAQFTPHVDTGNGAGQSVSLIVALGDFVGGEIVIEGQAHDIRYLPIEFNGWTERHWTNPFEGERYSLVWFTPMGCENMPGLNLN